MVYNQGNETKGKNQKQKQGWIKRRVVSQGDDEGEERKGWKL